jgi:LysW-gamma-L-alpha-aminoadipyl-6-phosphate/LysW-L-glutamyl-5-phosphate reductase
VSLSVSVVGASGYAGGELLRLLARHPGAHLQQATSNRYAGKPIVSRHPNLRGVINAAFVSQQKLQPCDVLCLCLPHGEAMQQIDALAALAPVIIDLSGDFRLRSAEDYPRWYGRPHLRPELLERFVYGIPELHRARMTKGAWISSAGCNATAVILALYPLCKRGLIDASRTVVEVKVGSSEGGAEAGEASHHPERSGCVRSYSPTGHRHVAEMVQELGGGQPFDLHFSATAIEMVRGVLATCHVFLTRDLDEKDIWKIYRDEYGREPFIRIVKSKEGLHRYPEPKFLSGTNYCDIGFERDPHTNRLVVISAIDNLMKGAAGQAVQAMNIAHGLPETSGLDFPGLHPI